MRRRSNRRRWLAKLTLGLFSRHTDPVVLAMSSILSTIRTWLRSEPVDAAQDVGEQVTRNGDLGHLEDDVAPVAHDLRADLDELFPEAGQRPLLHGIGQSERAHEIAEVVGERMKLEPDGVVVKRPASTVSSPNLALTR